MSPATTGVRRRLPADERRTLILKAARKAFIDSGDMSGTTIKAIARQAKISEGLIYRHFESKEQLYIEAVVDPLREVVDVMIERQEQLRDQVISPAAAAEVVRELNEGLVSTLEEILPLLGLVLFGDPKLAKRFYQQNFGAAMDRMAEAWVASNTPGTFDWETDKADVWVRALMGMCLMVALEDRYNPGFDRARAITAITEAELRGFFPVPEEKRKSRRKA